MILQLLTWGHIMYVMFIKQIGFLLNKALQKTRRPHLKDEVCVFERLEGRRKHYGDYLWYVIFFLLSLV